MRFVWFWFNTSFRGVVLRDEFQFKILIFYLTKQCLLFDAHVTVYRDKFLIIKPTRCTNFSNLFLEWNAASFGHFLCPSSGVYHCTHSNDVSYWFAGSLWAGSGFFCFWGVYFIINDLVYFIGWNIITLNGRSIIMAFLFDWMSLLFMGLVCIISSLVILYSDDYMFVIWIFHMIHPEDRLCGLVVRVSDYRYRGLGFDSRRYQIFWVIVGLERGPLSLVRSIEELLE